MLDERGLDEVTLAEIARASGFAKSNVYRYFESREALLLELLVEDQSGWVEALERALAPLAGRGDPSTVGDAICDTLLEFPRLCELTAALAAVLEQNVGLEGIIAFKRRAVALSIRMGNALATALPGFPIANLPTLVRLLIAMVAGLWPMAHPSPLHAVAMNDPELAMLRTEFERDFRRAAIALLTGLCQTPKGASKAAPG